VMEELAHEGATMIVVTHEMAFAREAADRVYFIDDGRFVEVGPPEQVIDLPQDPRTREFLARTHGTGAHVHPSAAAPRPAPDPLTVQASVGQPGLTAVPIRSEREDT
jgi:ABC-type glutathione transport system ATPase component